MRIVNASSREIERSGWISLGPPVLPSSIPPPASAAPPTFIRSRVDGPCSSPGRGVRSRLSFPARVSATSGCIERTARALDVCVATLSPAVAPPSLRATAKVPLGHGQTRYTRLLAESNVRSICRLLRILEQNIRYLTLRKAMFCYSRYDRD